MRPCARLIIIYLHTMFKKISIVVVSVIVIGVGYYAISPLFRHTRIDEAAPQVKETVSMHGTTTAVRNVSTSSIQKTDVIGKEVVAPVIGTRGHPGSGTARIIKTESGVVLRYENFKTLNGPDLYVYLAKDLDAKEYVSLGKLQATEGNVNYEVPVNINVSEYKYVMVWCKQFGVLFNYADLSVLR